MTFLLLEEILMKESKKSELGLGKHSSTFNRNRVLDPEVFSLNVMPIPAFRREGQHLLEKAKLGHNTLIDFYPELFDECLRGVQYQIAHKYFNKTCPATDNRNPIQASIIESLKGTDLYIENRTQEFPVRLLDILVVSIAFSTVAVEINADRYIQYFISKGLDLYLKGFFNCHGAAGIDRETLAELNQNDIELAFSQDKESLFSEFSIQDIAIHTVNFFKKFRTEMLVFESESVNEEYTFSKPLNSMSLEHSVGLFIRTLCVETSQGSVNDAWHGPLIRLYRFLAFELDLKLSTSHRSVSILQTVFYNWCHVCLSCEINIEDWHLIQWLPLSPSIKIFETLGILRPNASLNHSTESDLYQSDLEKISFVLIEVIIDKIQDTMQYRPDPIEIAILLSEENDTTMEPFVDIRDNGLIDSAYDIRPRF